MKDRQKLEAHTLIEYEIKHQILRKEQEDHLNLLKMEEDRDKRDFYRQKKLKDLEDRKKELFFNLKEVNELIESQNTFNDPKDIDRALYFGMHPEDAKDMLEHIIQQINDEISRINNEEGEEKKRKNDTKLKQLDLEKKHKEFHEKSFKNYMDQYKNSFEIRKLAEIKEKKRLESIETKRLLKIKEHEKSMLVHKKRFEENNLKLEEKLKKESEITSKKLIASNENRKQLEELRKIALKKKVETHLKKQGEIKTFLEKHQEIDDLKYIQLKRKMQELEKKKTLFDQIKDNEIKERIMDINIKSNKTKQSRELIKQEIAKEGEFTMKKIHNFFNKSSKKKELIEREQMFKCEINEQKRNVVELKNKRNDVIREIERKKALGKIHEDCKKSEDFKTQKIINSNKKRILAIELSNQRKLTLDKLDELLNKYKEISVRLKFL